MLLAASPPLPHSLSGTKLGGDDREPRGQGVSSSQSGNLPDPPFVLLREQ